MTEEQKITTVQTLLGNDSEATTALVTVYVALAKSQILNRLYPFEIPDTVTNVPAKYEYTQCELARNLFLKRGAEGEIVHNENGINRTYEGNEPLLDQIVPIAKV